MDYPLAGENGAGNTRNGYGRKTVMTDTGSLAIDVPRDRQSSFDPQMIAKDQRRFPGFDEKIVSMYARGMSTREITGHLQELYGIDVSPDLISTVTDAVLDEIAAWQQRPLDPVYPLVFFDAIRVKIRDEGMVRNKAIHIALGVRADGAKDVLGLWLEQNEGATFWLRVMIEALNAKLRRAVRVRGHFPSDEAATKLLCLILNRSEKEWKTPPREGSMAKAQFAVIFGDRFIRAVGA
ncbi:Transposase, mutator type [Rhodospirillum rubrum ATCC 11170]|uniref:Mutator family transposase n=1 Tax=Rhodospirillum rubrum (strain ATCC 11170 / ATH 1.1.1 / DSM 467 / LMG 4362 / NCIMB 8255 / S1) TaxID=269796 RepID=Q2RW76_RHORT|nr:Transposase, mutator type [Rhodospirillum rubrum ATCC 11170]